MIISKFLFLFLLYPSLIHPLENFIYHLEQSNPSISVWTTLPSKHVFRSDPVPAAEKSFIQVYLAQNEYEPCQIILTPHENQNLSLNLLPLDPNHIINSEFFIVDYVPITKVTDEGIGARTGDTPDVIFPANYGNYSLIAGENLPLWILFNASSETLPGTYDFLLKIGLISVPIKVKVFGFQLPKEIHFYSQMNINFNAVLTKYSANKVSEAYFQVLEKFKVWLIQHRITPAGSLWSGGLTSAGCPYISYNCEDKSWSDKYGIWGFEANAKRYIQGENGFNNGFGWPNFMALGLKNNDCSTEQRCKSLCNLSPLLTDWPINDVNSDYNKVWLDYLESMQSYLERLGLIDKAYAYMWNEPQNADDYDAVACSSQAMFQKAPKLKRMVSEEPKPEIYNNTKCPNAKIDIWLPVFNNYNHTVSWDRLKNNNEETWIYHLCHNNKPPFFNFVTLDHEPIENLLVGLFHWKYRVRGLAYYAFNNWGNNPYTTPQNYEGNGAQFLFYPPSKDNSNIPYGSNGNRFVPSQRMEILRDSIEFYEYLWLLNGGELAKPYESNFIDKLITDKVILGEKSYLRDDNFIYNLRMNIGLYLGGEIAYIPDLVPDCNTSRCNEKPRDYYINFQKMTDPVVIIDNNTYLSVDWAIYNQTLGYGWWGRPDQRKYGSSWTKDPRLNSILYDDYGRMHTFEFDLPKGNYDVTVSVGWSGRTYRNHLISVNGVEFFNVEETNATVSYMSRTRKVHCDTNKLFLEMGDGKEYTMLNYMIIKPEN